MTAGGRGGAPALAWLVALLLAARPASAGEPRPSGPPAPGAPEAPAAGQADASPGPGPDGRRTAARLPANLLRNAAGLVAEDNLVPFLVAGGLTAASFALDDRVRRELRGRDLGGLQSFGDTLGDAEVVVPLTAGLFLAGRIAGDRRFRDLTYDIAQSQLVVGALGGTLKTLVGRERPNASNARSFPSGHSYAWFNIATSVDRHYGFKASLPVYGLWAVAGLSRVANDAHHWSDMVGGAALGYLVARTTRRVNDAPLPPGRAQQAAGRSARRWIAPVLGVRGRQLGIVVALEF